MNEHPLRWRKGEPFPPREVRQRSNPYSKRGQGLWVGVCIFCGGSLGGPYQEDLFHDECLRKEVTE